MSTFPKLNIDIRDLTKKPKKLQFVIQPEPEPPPKQAPRRCYIIFILLLCFFISYMFATPTRRLRKIIRMSCSISNGRQVCSAYGHGEYVVNAEGCNSFEFNGIPFTDLMNNGHYRIPSSPDMSLHIIEPCPTIVATIDTRTMIPYTEYARKGEVYTKRAVWITENCYEDFTVRIGEEIVLDKTPISMIEHVSIGNITACTYESQGVSGQLIISGRGCDKPIHIYSI